jgi:Cu+-exporting ATPase
MRRPFLFSLVAGLVLAASFAAFAADKPQTPDKPQTLCPVAGEPIDKAKSLEMQGQKVYFCCDRCKGKFKADPETYFTKMAKDGVVAESVQKTDPMCGMKVDPAKSVRLDHKGRRIYFCSDGCKAAFEKDADKNLAKLDEKPKA